MDRKIPMFVGGALGAAVFFGLFFARSWDAMNGLIGIAGAKGAAVAITVAVLVALVTGLLTMLVHPHNFVGAMLFGLVPPALMVALSIPRGGLPPVQPDKGLAESLGKKKVLFAVYHALNPVETIAVLKADQSVAEQRKSMDRLIARAKADNDNHWREDLAKQLQDARTAAAQAQAAAVKAEQEKGAAARAAAVKATTASLQSDVDAANAAAAESDKKAAAANAQVAKFVGRIAELERQLREAGAAAGSAGSLQAKLTAAAQAAADAEARAAAAEAELDDYARLADWYQNSPPNSGARLAKVLQYRLRSRDPGDRLTAARLFPLCGPSAKEFLRKAVNDSDPDVARAAKKSLERLGG